MNICESSNNKDLKTLINAASILRKDIERSPKWKFDGSFDEYCEPPLLLWFCKYMIKAAGKVNAAEKDVSV